MSIAETTDGSEILDPGKQPTQTLSDIFDKLIVEQDVTEENYLLLDTHQLVTLALQGVKIRLSELQHELDVVQG